ncbi:uncharacterized protein METZ01_LOCUS256227, partial [marine metagenome]
MVNENEPMICTGGNMATNYPSKRTFVCTNHVALAIWVFMAAIVMTCPALVSAQQTTQNELVTFSRDIAPILQRSCQECHRPGSVAPMS